MRVAVDIFAERLGHRHRARRPAVIATAVIVTGVIVLAAIMVGLGLLVTRGVVGDSIGRWDESANDWFLLQRTAALNSVTAFGSEIAMTGTVIAIEVVAVAILAIRRCWRDLAFLVIALASEASVFLITTLVINRPRPTVPKLDPAPPTSSFPSGHTAAAIALYVGLAIVIDRRLHQRLLRAALWLVALLIPLFVGLSRIYRGMHHPTDVLGGIVLGVLALTLASLTMLTSDAVADLRKRSAADALEPTRLADAAR